MTRRTWVILGATSIIAKEFSHILAQKQQKILLVGRDLNQLKIIAIDIKLRYQVSCTWLCIDLASDLLELLTLFQQEKDELDLFIAHSFITPNQELSLETMATMINTNVLSTAQIIHAYLQRSQTSYKILFLSSIAACRGRSKNSLYGGSKAAIEIFLEGLHQSLNSKVQITIARLGFIDTIQTYGLPEIFYASLPKSCAKACWRALQKQKRLIYYPFFWRFIAYLLKCLPFFIYKRLNI